MKIVFVTPEEPSILPPFFEKVIAARREKIVGIVVVSPIYKNATWFSQAWRFIRAFGLWEFLVEGFFFGYYKILDAVSRFVLLGRFYSLKRLAEFHRIPLYQPQDVNAPAFLDTLRRLSPDLIISVSPPQVFRESLIELPTFGCINVHSSLLPKYRGILPTFWVLANGEQETGVTVHYISKGIDEGDIILQEKVEITPEETLHSLMKKCKEVGANLLLEVLKQFEEGSVSALPSRLEEGSYFSFPRREDVRRFKAYGRRVR